MEIHFNQWLSYFYFYCLFGWVFESSYVSLKSRKWTNRGFMKGPWLPLYGSGAIVILLGTLPFVNYPWAVWLMGAVLATVLEYVTGVVMVKLFKVRYWDYSNQKIQFQGHICLTSSLAWGFLSLLMVYVIHPPIQNWLARWNPELLNVATFLITICMVYDFANAFRTAMDLRKLLEEAEKLKENLQAFWQEERTNVRIKAMEQKERFEEASAEAKEFFERNAREMEKAGEELKEKIVLKAKHLLLHNPGSGFAGLEEEAKEIRRRLLEKYGRK